MCPPFVGKLSDAHTAPVGRFGPNGYGLHDMAGNAWEQCADLYVLEDETNPPPGQGVHSAP